MSKRLSGYMHRRLTEPGGGRHWVNLEHIAWAQDPKTHEKLYGTRWDPPAEGMGGASGAKMRDRFNRLKTLIEYYDVQLDLYSEMCLDRCGPEGE